MNNRQVVSASFSNRTQAEQCISQLRSSGVPDDAISIIAQHEGELSATHADGTTHDHDHDDKASGAVKGAVAGGTVGALFGLAAFFIPGVGPFVTAGWLASTLGVAGGAAASGAIVGATAGTISGMLMDYGVNKEDASHYEQQLGQGGVIVMVDTASVPNPQAVQQVLQSSGGRTSSLAA